MSKLTFEFIQSQISLWFSGLHVREDIGILNEKNGFSEEHFSMFIDGKNWYEESLTSPEHNSPWFNEYTKQWEFGGDFDGVLEPFLSKCPLDEEWFDKCNMRTVMPQDHHLANTFRLEIFSNPEDDQIIGWTLITD